MLKKFLKILITIFTNTGIFWLILNMLGIEAEQFFEAEQIAWLDYVIIFVLMYPIFLLINMIEKNTSLKEYLVTIFTIASFLGIPILIMYPLRFFGIYIEWFSIGYFIVYVLFCFLEIKYILPLFNLPNIVYQVSDILFLAAIVLFVVFLSLL